MQKLESVVGTWSAGHREVARTAGTRAEADHHEIRRELFAEGVGRLLEIDAGYGDGSTVEIPGARAAPGKRRLIGAELADGSVVELPTAREVTWPVDLVRLREQIRRCESGGHLLRSPDGEWHAIPTWCRSPLCPRCARNRIGRWLHRWVPVFEAAAADGCRLYHLTLTQPQIAALGGLVFPDERRKYEGLYGPTGRPIPPVGGELMLPSYDRLRGSMDVMRDSRGGSREWWKHLVPASVYGIEWTLRPESARGPIVPRWHCHVHLLAMVPEGGWTDFRSAWLEIRGKWTDISGGVAKAQHCSIVEPDRLVEVIKYPTKIKELTRAATCEWYGSARGLRPHHLAGALHSRSKLHDQQPWAGWLEHRRDPPNWPRLQVRLHRDGGVWEDYSGQLRAGEADWSIGGPQPHVWRASAEGYFRILRAGLESDDARAGRELADCSVGELEVVGEA